LNRTQFECYVIFRNRRNFGSLLYSTPENTNVNHKWSAWDYCSDDHYVVGFGAKRHEATGLITGLRFLCHNPTAPEDLENKVQLEAIGLIEIPLGKYAVERKCSGVATGIQASYRNMSLTGFKFDCSWARTGSSAFVQDSLPGTSQSEWTSHQRCPSKHAICGFQTSIGGNGLRGIGIKCCKIPNPAEVCIPHDQWILLTSYDNRNGTSPLSYAVTRRIGLTLTNSVHKSEGRDKSFAESIGYDTSLSTENTRTVSAGSAKDITSSTSNQISEELSTNQVLANTMSKGSSSEVSSGWSETTDSRESETTHASNTKGHERSTNSHSGHEAGGSAGISFPVKFLWVSLNGEYKYNTHSGEAEAHTSSYTKGSSTTKEKGKQNVRTGSTTDRNYEETTDSETKSWGKQFSELASKTRSQSESINEQRQFVSSRRGVSSDSTNMNLGKTESKKLFKI